MSRVWLWMQFLLVRVVGLVEKKTAVSHGLTRMTGHKEEGPDRQLAFFTCFPAFGTNLHMGTS